MLLNKLVEIDRGKALSVLSHDRPKRQMRSLHLSRWKKESKQIDFENHRLKNAIINVKSKIPCKQRRLQTLSNSPPRYDFSQNTRELLTFAPADYVSHGLKDSMDRLGLRNLQHFQSLK